MINKVCKLFSNLLKKEEKNPYSSFFPNTSGGTSLYWHDEGEYFSVDHEEFIMFFKTKEKFNMDTRKIIFHYSKSNKIWGSHYYN